MILCIETPKACIEVKNHGFWISAEENTRLIMPDKISTIIISEDVFIKAEALILAAQHQIPVYFQGAYNEIIAYSRSVEYNLQASLRRKHILFLENFEKRTNWCKWLFKQKLENQILVMKYIADRKPAVESEILERISAINNIQKKINQISADTFELFLNTLLGFEGSCARQYWKGISEGLDASWQFNGRSRQPAQDAFNTALNYLYSLLYAEIENAINLAGLDSHQGIFHAEHYQKSVFTFDFIELFRVWVDRLLIDLIKDGSLQISQFQLVKNGVFISKEGKAILIPAFKKMMNARKMYLGRNATAKLHISYAIEYLKSQF